MNKLTNIILLCAMSALLLGCPTGPDGKPTWPPPGGLLFPDSKPPATTPTPAATEGKEWTIQLAEFRTPAPHVARAATYLKSAKEVTRWSGLFVIHEENASRVHWGRFVSRTELEPSLAKARAWKNSHGAQPFARAVPVRLTTADASGPKEYDIRNAPPAAYYTVVVAIFRDRPGHPRQKECLYTVNELRKAGTQAWYHHGPNYSAVMLETFPASAMETVREAVRHPQTGDISYVEKQKNKSKRITELLNKYPEMLINGAMEKTSQFDPEQGKFVMKTRMSYVSVIPGRKGKAPAGGAATPASGNRYWERMNR